MLTILFTDRCANIVNYVLNHPISAVFRVATYRASTFECWTVEKNIIVKQLGMLPELIFQHTLLSMADYPTLTKPASGQNTTT